MSKTLSAKAIRKEIAKLTDELELMSVRMIREAGLMRMFAYLSHAAIVTPEQKSRYDELYWNLHNLHDRRKLGENREHLEEQVTKQYAKEFGRKPKKIKSHTINCDGCNVTFPAVVADGVWYQVEWLEDESFTLERMEHSPSSLVA